MAYTSRQVSVLQSERTNDPHARSYSGMDDNQFLTSVNLADIAQPRLTDAAEVFNAYVGSELPARSSDKWQNLLLLGSMNAGNPFFLEGNVLAVLLDAFPSGTADSTRANLLVLSTEDKSPAALAGLPPPSLGDVERTT